MANNRLLITTTNTIEGVEFSHYKGIISARVVTGTDFFSDLLAGVSDFIGGRSTTYQNQLKSIYDEVIELLSEEAKQLGANAILGVSIDNDEITGRGKQMFMVTATGTAAVISSIAEDHEEALEEISFERYHKEYRRLKIIFDIKNDLYNIESNWTYLIQNTVHEVMEEVYSYYRAEIYSHMGTNENTIKYFSEIEENQAQHFLYQKLKEETEFSYLGRLIKATKLIDYQYLLSETPNAEEALKKVYLLLSLGDKRKYRKEDIQNISELIVLFTEVFPIRSLSKDQDKWTCQCGKGNKASQHYCKSCDKDGRGFTKEDLDYDHSIALLKEKKYVLETIFGKA